MAPNELKPHSSSSEEDEEAGEEEEATGSEDEQQSGSESEQPSDSASDQKPKPKPKPDPKKTLISPSNPKSAIKLQAPDVSSSETGDSDSDSPPQKSTAAAVAAVDPKIKPVSSVPKESKLMKKSGGSKSKSTSSAAPVRNKRPAAAPANENNKKKAKGIAAAGDEESKKQLFQRLWSEDDEIVVLKGMIDYKAKSGGENTITDMGAFHEFIKMSLHVDVSRGQLVDKIRRLKKKYVNNASRENNGKSRSFSKSHEQKGYELSKLIWGGGSSQGKMIVQKNGDNVKGNAATASTSTSTSTGGGGLVKLNGLGDREVAVVVEKNMDISRFVQYGGRNDSPVSVEEIVKGGMELAVGEKRVELEERWRSLKKQELEIYLKKMDFVKEQALVVLEAVNASGN